MRCSRCERLTAEEQRSHIAPRPPRVADDDKLRLLLCERCGAVLPSTDADEDMLRKLSQFARFGLHAGAAPLTRGPTRTGTEGN